MNRRAGVVLSVAASFGCGGGDLMLPNTRVPAVLAIESGDRQNGPAGTVLADPIVVRVTDAADRSVQGARVEFSASGDGELAPAAAVTGADGTASARWTLDRDPGTQQATAAVVDSAAPAGLTVTFTATASAAGPRSTVIRILEHSPNPSDQGRSVLVRVSVEPSGGGSVPDGPFSVSASSGEPCAGRVSAGTCDFIFNSAGTRTLVARYPGTDGFEPSESAPVSHTVNPVASPTQTLIGTGPDPSEQGEPVTIFATVRASSGNDRPRGVVVFYDRSPRCGEGDLLGQTELNGKGQGTFTTTGLSVGFHTIRGCYTGSAEFSPSEDVANQTVRED
jgi:hypothetical protein